MRKHIKQAISVIAVIAIIVALGLGAFSYFTDYVSQRITAEAGSIDLIFTDVSSAAEHKLDSQTNTLDKVWSRGQLTADIMNPGDNFDLGYILSNAGSKSIDVKQQIVLTSSIELTDGSEEYTIVIAGQEITPVKSEDSKTLTYELEEITLQGSVEKDGNAAEQEYDVYLAFDSMAKNKFMDSSVTVNLDIQAKQHRNTDDSIWADWAEYTVKFEQIDKTVYAENLFNPDDENTLKNMMFYSNASTLVSQDTYFVTNYIPVTEGDVLYYQYYLPEYYSFSGDEFCYSRQYVLYDENKEVLAEISNLDNAISSGNITVPAGAAYIRLVPRMDYFDTLVVSTSPIKEYIAYGETVVEKDILLHLAEQYDVAIGHPVSIYNVNICPASLKYDIEFEWDNSSIGTVSSTGITIDPTEADIGTHEVSVNIYTDGKLYASASTTINVVADELSNEINLLCIGDSLTSYKAWLGYLEAFSSDKITTVGTKEGFTRIDYPTDNYGVYINDDGYPGASVECLFTKSTIYDITNPFYNPETATFDYSYYKQSTGIDADAIVLLIGRNGMYSDPTANVENIVNLINKIREVDSTVPLFVVNTVRDNADYSTSIMSLTLMRALNTIVSEMDNCHIVPLQSCYDAESYSVDEAVHPSELAGWRQFADVIYSSIVANS